MNFLQNLSKFFKIKNPYLVSLPILGTTGWSAYSIVQNGDLVSNIEHNYLARVELTKPVGDDDSTDNKIKVHGQEIDFSDEKKVVELAKEDRQRLFNYYRNYDPKHMSVSTDDALKPTKTANDPHNVNFFIHLRDKKTLKNGNNFWLENVILNQISIDRYGFEYDDEGKKKNDVQAKTHRIVDWKDIELDKIAREDYGKKLPSISFRIHKAIPKEEVAILINENDEKYVIDEKTDEDSSKDWFVWMDKDLLALKLNYALQTYSFKQNGLREEQQIKSILGDDESKANDRQKAKRRAIDSNYENLPEGYEQFAKDYIKLFIDTSATDQTVKWSQVINYITQTSSFIQTDDINKIYNRFLKQKKEVNLFKPHLITKITSGKTGTWKISLNLEKEEKKDEDKDKDKKKDEDGPKERSEEIEKEKDDPLVKKYEAREIKALTEGESEDERKKNIIHLVHEPELIANYNVNEVFEKITKYSVRYFAFSKTPKTLSSVYTSSTDGEESLKLISFQHANEFGIYTQEKWIPIILGIVFLSGILYYLITTFKGPGALIGTSIAVSATNVAGVFFALGSQLSLIGIFASFIGIFFTLFLSYYSLGFLKKVFDIEFLDASNVWVVFKRGLVMATDISLPFFIYSTLLVFLSPIHVREFGIVLALFALFSYLFVSVLGCLMAIKKASSQFIDLGKFFKKRQTQETSCLKFCDKISSRLGNFIITSGVALVILIIGIITCAFAWNSFNSHSFLKENVLVIERDGKSPLVDADLTDASYTSLQGVNSYLVHKLPVEKLEELKNKAFITSTGAFSDFYTIKDLGFSFACSLGLIFTYVFLRFKFKNLLILACNTLTAGILFSILLLVTRIPITSSIVIAYCSILILVILYHIILFGLDSEQVAEWYSPLVEDIKQGMFSKIGGTVVWFACVSALTAFTSFWMFAIYVVLAIVLAHLLSGFLYKFWFERLNFIKNTYMWETKKSHDKEEEESLDLYDEELIEGINKRY